MSLTLSPLYGHITDTVAGLVTIRAFRFEIRFLERLRVLLDAHLSAQCNIKFAMSVMSVINFRHESRWRSMAKRAITVARRSYGRGNWFHGRPAEPSI